MQKVNKLIKSLQKYLKVKKVEFSYTFVKNCANFTESYKLAINYSKLFSKCTNLRKSVQNLQTLPPHKMHSSQRFFYDRVCSIKRVLGPFIPPALCFFLRSSIVKHRIFRSSTLFMCEKVNSSDRFWICLKINLFKNKNWFPIPTRFDCEQYLGIEFRSASSLYERTWNPANFFRGNA